MPPIYLGKLNTVPLTFQTLESLRDLMIIPRDSSPLLPEETEARGTLEKEQRGSGIKRELSDSGPSAVLHPTPGLSRKRARASTQESDIDVQYIGSRSLKKSCGEDVSLLSD
jgi:hypothetical protein